MAGLEYCRIRVRHPAHDIGHGHGFRARQTHSHGVRVTVTHPVTLAMLLWMGIALLTFLLMSVWTDNPQHRSTYRHWAVAYLTALIVIITVFYSEGTRSHHRFENHRRRPERPAIPADSSAQRQGRGIVRHVRRRLDRKRGHIRGRGEEPQPLDGRHRDPMGFADRLDQPHRKNHLAKQETSC